MPDDPQRTAPKPKDPIGDSGSPGAPVYRKPVLRKYDQIEQVKPYGPSEMEAS
jgi:hypothetical protein